MEQLLRLTRAHISSSILNKWVLALVQLKLEYSGDISKDLVRIHGGIQGISS